MPPSLLQDGGRKAAELHVYRVNRPADFLPPAGFFPPEFLKVPGGRHD
jgi:hypothetical protein